MSSPNQPAPGTVFTEEYEDRPVPPSARRSLASISAVWVGFPMILTCAVFGGLVVYSLGFWTGLLAMVVGSLVLMAYVGTLSFLAGRTGENFALTATRTFGRRGYLVPAAFLATIVIGWFAFQTGLTGSILHESLGWNEPVTALVAGLGFIAVTLVGIRALSVIGMVAAPVYVVLGVVAIVVAASRDGAGSVSSYTGGAGVGALSFGAAVTLVVASFIDSGTMTGDFTRWSRDGRAGALAAFAAFPVANLVALVVGGVVVALGASANPADQGGNFLDILIAQGGILVPLAVAFVFINLGSVCAHCLYNGAVGWSQLTHGRMRGLTLALGAVGTVLAVAGIWSYFETWLVLLGVVVPPIGIVIILDQIVLPRLGLSRPSDRRADSTIPAAHWSPFVAWVLGSVAALVAHAEAPWLSDALVAMVVTAAAYTSSRAIAGGRSARQAAAPAHDTTTASEALR